MTVIDINCEKINNKCMQSCTCISENRYSDNILRIFDVDELYKWEIQVYLKLLDTNITPFISYNNNRICYELTGYISLRTFLEKKENQEKSSLIINELYSFINTFKKYNFIHGNLHIDNIFIKNDQCNKTNFDFKVIDYVNSYLLNKKYENHKYKKSSFVGEYKKKENKYFMQYWDFFTIYVSLKLFLRNKYNELYTLQNIVESYIPNNIFNNILNETLKETMYKSIRTEFYE